MKGMSRWTFKGWRGLYVPHRVSPFEWPWVQVISSKFDDGLTVKWLYVFNFVWEVRQSARFDGCFKRGEKLDI